MVVLRDGEVAGERAVAATTPDETILLIVGREPSQMFRRPAERQGAPRLEFAQACVRRGRAASMRASMRARSSASSACAAPGRRWSAAHCSAWRRPAAAQSARRRRGRRSRSPRRGDGARRQSGVRRPRRRIDPAEPRRCARICFSTRAPRDARCCRCSAPRREMRGVATTRRDGRSAAQRSDARRSNCCRAATSRRSWSGAGCISNRKIYVFEDPTAGVDVGAKAEIYRLFDRRPAGRRGDPDRLDRFRGGRRRSAIARWCSIAAASWRELHGRAICRSSNLLAAASANIERRRRRPACTGRRCNRIKSNALEPTEPELAAIERGAGDPAAGCRSTACRS